MVFLKHEVLPYASGYWYVPKNSVKIGYEISVIRYFYKPQSLRPMAEVRAEQETDGLLDKIIGDDGA